MGASWVLPSVTSSTGHSAVYVHVNKNTIFLNFFLVRILLPHVQYVCKLELDAIHALYIHSFILALQSFIMATVK